MKTLIVSIAFLASILFCNAQDYFEVVVASQETTFNYPDNSLFTLTDETGSSRKIDEEDYIKVTGNYTVTVDVPWSESPEIIESKGESLVIRKLPEADYKYNTNTIWNEAEYTGKTDSEGNPVLINKNVFLNKKTNKIEGYFFFSNSMVFCYVNGVARAYQHNKKLPIKGKYLMQGTDALLKLSYNPKTGKMWYVFEKNANK